MILRWLQRKPTGIWAGLLIVVIYLLSRFVRLTALPVFADEAIYIRWAQLIVHEPVRYAFFALNDGKPPLFIWMLTPLMSVPLDPLWSARLVAIIAGLGQLLANDWIIRRLGGGYLARLVSVGIVVLAPFWFFHHRMALFDGWLSLWLSLTLAGLLILQEKKHRLPGLLIAGVSWGLALLTKTPALFFAPVFPLLAYAGPFVLSAKPKTKRSLKFFWQQTIWFAGAGLLGLGIFGLLRLHPAFGSLFTRSGDFTFTTAELLAGNWQTSLDNIWRLLQWLSAYLRPEIISLSAIALIISHQRGTHLLLWTIALIFAAPLLIFGRTLHPRYFLPMAPFITLSAALFAQEAWRLVSKTKDSIFPFIYFALIGFFAIGSLRFIFLSYLNPNQTPFVLHDREQYLTSWSSGHGLIQIREKLLERAHRGERTTVVTEGSFGTLPDGLLLYFDQAPEIAYLRIEGLAQYPVKFLPEWVLEEASHTETWLVVNENRMEVPLEQVELLSRYPRPYGAPDLQLYKVLTNE